ncbi:hypothetical protein FAI40_09960 [Acetobacteraceae bacterium]|nr:hypothetical protein FAI40_09960 [Acetobacteraceae bacterium]
MFKILLSLSCAVLLAGCSHAIENKYMPTPKYLTPSEYQEAASDMKTVPATSPAWNMLNDYLVLRAELCSENNLGDQCEKLSK